MLTVNAVGGRDTRRSTSYVEDKGAKEVKGRRKRKKNQAVLL